MIAVRSLLGHNQVQTACLCLGSLLRQCENLERLILHDDGTLTSDDVDRLNQELGSPEIISRKEADSILVPRLENFPASVSYRKQHPLGLKLFDICLLQNPSEPMLFCDSDILFLRRFRFPEIHRNMAVFMMDSDLAVSLRPWHISPIGPARVMAKLNSGIIIIYPDKLDLHLIEKFLAQPSLAKVFALRPQWVEQTCWATLATQLDTRYLDPARVFVATEEMKPVTADQVAIHFVSSQRGKLTRYVGSEQAVSDVTSVDLCAARKASVWDILNGEIKMRRNRKLLLKKWAEST